MLRGLSKRARRLTSASTGYPAALRALADAPSELRVVGELPDLRHAISIVGTRRADDEALDFAYSLAREAALNGFAVVSGGAIGIDRAAREGAVDGGGRTVVVLRIGLDAPYPRANHDLFERVCRPVLAVPASPSVRQLTTRPVTDHVHSSTWDGRYPRGKVATWDRKVLLFLRRNEDGLGVGGPVHIASFEADVVGVVGEPARQKVAVEWAS